MKFLFFLKERIAFYLTLLVVTGFSCTYYFICLPKNEADIKAWKFCSLQRIGRNAYAEIETGRKQLNVYLQSAAEKYIEENKNIYQLSLHYQFENFIKPFVIRLRQISTKVRIVLFVGHVLPNVNILKP